VRQAEYPQTPDIDKTRLTEGRPTSPRPSRTPDFKKLLASKPQPLALKLMRPKVK
jgi:hypothetical protein